MANISDTYGEIQLNVDDCSLDNYIKAKRIIKAAWSKLADMQTDAFFPKWMDEKEGFYAVESKFWAHGDETFSNSMEEFGREAGSVITDEEEKILEEIDFSITCEFADYVDGSCFYIARKSVSHKAGTPLEASVCTEHERRDVAVTASNLMTNGIFHYGEVMDLTFPQEEAMEWFVKWDPEDEADIRAAFEDKHSYEQLRNDYNEEIFIMEDAMEVDWKHYTEIANEHQKMVREMREERDR